MDYRTLLFLRAARAVGVLDAVTSDADTVADVAAAADVTEHAARVAVDVLRDEGFLAPVGEGFEPTNRLLGFLAKADVRSVGALPHRLDVADALVALPETMQSGERPARPDDWTVNDLGARRAADDVTTRARVTAAVREAPDADRVLVVGDGPGEHAREFATRGHEVVLAVAADVAERITPLLATEPVEVVARDAGDVLPSGFDLVVRPAGLRDRDPDANRDVLARTRDALQPDGTVVVLDAFRETVDDYAAVAAEVLATTDAGRVYAREDAAALLRAAGFSDVRTADVPGTDAGVVAGQASD